jgi:hypothetical protein
LSDISPIRLRALELAVQAGAYQNASQFLRFLQGGPGADEAFSQPAEGASSSATKPKATKAGKQAQDAPAQSPVVSAATAQAGTVSAPDTTGTPAASPTVRPAQTSVAPEVFQKKCADAVLALAKVDRDGAVAILEQYKVQRFGQMKPADYPEFYTKVEAALAAVAAKKAAEASDPASLV